MAAWHGCIAAGAAAARLDQFTQTRTLDGSVSLLLGVLRAHIQAHILLALGKEFDILQIFEQLGQPRAVLVGPPRLRRAPNQTPRYLDFKHETNRGIKSTE